ncbi:unnamed protein product [Rotaria sp. Silwood1]|nr:unnamed protein product [Rotaria sp. Silwood1]CAF1302405.1 unnamed protein product [Rotaria sp. Silwood1]
MFRFGCYIADLHNQIEKLGQEQRKIGSKNDKTYYRGKRYSIDVIQQFKDSIGHLIALNGLLSTTENYITSTVFAGMGETQDAYQSVIFEFNVDSKMTNLIRPYANINDRSACQDEEEVLFFMGFVWKIESMKKIGTNDWYIVLQSCTDYDPDLITYIEQARCHCTYITVGNILQELGDHTSATNFYQRMLLNETLSDETRVNFYFNMAALAEDQDRYFDAVNYLIQAKNLIKSTVSENNEVLAQPKPLFADNIVPSQLNLFNNMARAYMKAGKYQSAKKCFEDALQQNGSDIQRATVLNNYGLLEYTCRNIQQAEKYFQQAAELAKNDARGPEFKRNLDIVSKHIPKDTETTDAERKSEQTC